MTEVTGETFELVEVPDRATELTDDVLDWLHSTTARKVALFLTPVLLPVLGALSVWLQDAIGIDMPPTEAAVFCAAVIVGTAGTIAIWVFNHGRGAAGLGQILLELEKLYEAGRNELVADAAMQADGFEESGAQPDDVPF